MNIAFDVQPLLNNNKSGIGYCQYGFLDSLIKQYPKSRYIFNFWCLRIILRKQTRVKLMYFVKKILF